MLSKLHQHNNFLENDAAHAAPRNQQPAEYAQHVSLDNLAEESPEVRDSKYLESAKRGVTAHRGDRAEPGRCGQPRRKSLQAEEFEIIDIQQLLQNYVANCSVTHPRCKFVFRGSRDKPVFAKVADYRIEQLLDKIIDNAIDFHRSNSPIKVQLDTTRNI